MYIADRCQESVPAAVAIFWGIIIGTCQERGQIGTGLLLQQINVCLTAQALVFPSSPVPDHRQLLTMRDFSV